jgi:hypothetical protein
MQSRVQGWSWRIAARIVAAVLTAWTFQTHAAEPAALSAKSAAPQPGVDLLAADSRNDWIHKHAGAAGWMLADGALSGGTKSTPLVSTYALGDFELSVDWKVADGATLKLGFPQSSPSAQKSEPGAPKSQSVEICLAERPGISILLPQGAKILKVDPQLAGRVHRTIIKRVGDQLTLDCDGTRSRELPVAAEAKFGLTLAIDGGATTSDVSGRATVQSLRLIEPPATPKSEQTD